MDMPLADDEAIANAFANNFQSIFKESGSRTDNTDRINISNSSFQFSRVSESDILLCIRKLKKKFSSGPDKIPCFIFKDYGTSLVTPLQHIFNLSLKLSCFPNAFKDSYVRPIFKKGDPTDVRNYRGISISNNIVKIFETILFNQMQNYVSVYLSSSQHGFLPNRSTLSNQLSFVEYTLNVIDHGGQVDVLYVDMEKAFDTVDHGVILDRLAEFGFDDNTVQFFSSYLKNRYQYVVFRDKTSHKYRVLSGVPQGSVLGPFLFLMLIDPISNVINHSQISIFADDIKIFRSINSYEDSLLLLNDLSAITNWCKNNKVSINYKKCEVMSFTKKKSGPQLFTYTFYEGQSIRRVQSVSDLGVCFDSKLSFSVQHQSVISRANRMLGFVLRFTREFNDLNLTLTLYFSYVRSLLEYNSVVWYPSSADKQNGLERIQKKLVNVLFFRENGFYPTYPDNIAYNSLCQMLHLPTIYDRMQKSSLLLVYKLLNNRLDCPDLLEKCSITVPIPGLRPLHNNFFNIHYIPYLYHPP